MTPKAAKDEMLAVFKAAWDPTNYTVIYAGVPGAVPTSEQPWARVTVKTDAGGQKTLSDAVGARLYNSSGTLWVQIFTPTGDGGSRGLELAELVKAAYRTARGNVWYTKHRHKEVGPDGAFEQTNVLIDFSYDS